MTVTTLDTPSTDIVLMLAIKAVADACGWAMHPTVGAGRPADIVIVLRPMTALELDHDQHP